MRASLINVALICLLRCLFQPFAIAAQELATVTLLEGSLQVIRGTTVLRGAEGVKLRAGDIVESSRSGFAQAEFPGGTVIALGPSTRVFFPSHGGAGAVGKVGEKTRTAEVIMLSGWLKGETGANAGTYRCATPALFAVSSDGTLVLHTTKDGTEVFVESGSAGISTVRTDGTLGNPGPAKAGQFFTRRAGKIIAIQARPSSEFLDSMPRPFRDTLPSRLAHLAGKTVEAKREDEVSYSEIQPWLTMAPRWRKGFVQRFQPRLKDAEFRKELEAHLEEHPEWAPVLHPENAPTGAKAAENSDSSNRRQAK